MFNLDIEKTLNKYNFIIGLDEAGRGCCAGPLVVAGVVLPKNYQNSLINDSKKLTPKMREVAFEQIINDALEYKILFASAKTVDLLNPKQTSRLLMEQIVKQTKNIDFIITDFEKLSIENIPQLNLVKGDSQSLSVAAASILAKVSRDRYMCEIAKIYPQYNFEEHKGYGTQKHQALIEKYNVCPEHRKTYKNVKKVLNLQ
ncbi:ribonuclease HII [Mycoplasmopsis mucosicanis]|uniref:Ribonuclease n=1 Tax=Mycoplasmopsis mucosicanis TaxID=458208 RepID=A0A507SQD1_9BACT|nr:ribonuclease HII [Mycoplasmopsis mucosicanis]TQC54020.1 ribonuclease HII [Mycoplasmopsis mucosicanis]